MVATRPETDTIAIARIFDGIEEAAHRVIEQVGGMASVLKDAKKLSRFHVPRILNEACPENAISVKGYSGARQ